MFMPGKFWLVAASLAVLATAPSGCSRRIVSDPRPDKEGLALKIPPGGGESAEAEDSAEAVTATTEWGDLTGRFVLDGSVPPPARLNINKDENVCGKHDLVDEGLLVGPEGGLKNVLIYVITKKVPVNPDYEATATDTLRFDNKNCRFEPHILPLRLTAELWNCTIPDPIGHNSNYTPLGDEGGNPLLSSDGSATHQFKKSQNLPVPVTCSIHSWMKGYVLPRDNPYFAVTGEDGSFKIEKLPAGKLEFQIWQESVGGLAARPEWKKGRIKLEIKPGANTLVDGGTVTVNSSVFAK